jgi:hypothetical protein
LHCVRLELGYRDGAYADAALTFLDVLPIAAG